MRDKKIYLHKSIETGRWSVLRKIRITLRKKEYYDAAGIGVWWRLYYGLGIHGTNTMVKNLMVGVNFFNLKFWFDFAWIGKKVTFVSEDDSLDDDDTEYKLVQY